MRKASPGETFESGRTTDVTEQIVQNGIIILQIMLLFCDFPTDLMLPGNISTSLWIEVDFDYEIYLIIGSWQLAVGSWQLAEV